MVESSNANNSAFPNQNAVDFKVTIIDHDVVDNQYVSYYIKVVGPKEISFHIKDRYSSIREF